MTQITKQQYYELLGLLTLGRKFAKQIHELEIATAEILNIPNKNKSKYFESYDKGGYFLSDGIWEEEDIETGLKKRLNNEKIKVVKPQKTKKK